MDNQSTEQTQELTIIEKSLDTFKQAGHILKSNQGRVSKALVVGNKIIADWNAAGRVMSPELDTRMQNYLSNCSQAKTKMNEDRKAITQVLDMIKKAFTSEENKVDVTNADTIAFQMQQIRNDYARQLHEEEQARQREIELKKQKDQEAINLKAECKKRLVSYVNSAIANEKMRINNAFNAISLETYEEKSAKLKAMQPIYAYAHFQQFAHGLSSRLFTPAELGEILNNAIASEYDNMSSEYITQITELQNFLIDRLPSKKQELELIQQQEEERQKELAEQERIRKERETANAERQKQLDEERKASEERQRLADEEKRKTEEERRQREQEESNRLKREQETREKEQLQQVEDSKQVDTLTSLFNTEVDMAAASESKPEVRQGYEIEVSGTAGWMQIFQQWFNEHGRNLDNEKIAGTKMDTMKTFCEKLAHKDESKKITSNFITYVPSFKAVNRKVK